MSIPRRYRIVLANGCFDMLHYGHLIHLQEAAKMGNLLVVSITDDAHVNKGPQRPVYPEQQRAELIRALRCVDDVLIVASLIEAMEAVRPDILVKGADYKIHGLDAKHANYCKKHNIQIRFTDTSILSTSRLIDESRRRS